MSEITNYFLNLFSSMKTNKPILYETCKIIFEIIFRVFSLGTQFKKYSNRNLLPLDSKLS